MSSGDKEKKEIKQIILKSLRGQVFNLLIDV